MRPRLVDWIGVVLVCGSAALSALVELFLVPLYVGSVVMPVTVLLAVAGNIVLPRLAHSLVARTAAAVLPFVTWLLVVIAIGWFARPEGDVVLPGSGGAEWVGFAVSLGGAVAGTITVVMLSPPPAPRPAKGDRQPVKG